MLALVILAGALFLAVTMVIAWLVYTVATLRSEVAYISEVNKVIDHVNAIAHGVQQAHYRSTTRIDRADALAAAANERGVELDSRVDTVLARINSNASTARRNKDKLDEVEVAVDGVSTAALANTSALGDHGVRLVDLESSITGLMGTDELDGRLEKYVLAADLPPEQDLNGYARWSDFDQANLTTNSLRSGAVELRGPDPSDSGSITYTGDGIAMVTGIGNQPTKISSNSLEFGANALRIDGDGDLAYCKAGMGCEKVQTA
eukprot:jgi/Tetstr1/454054/TSEL_040973.t1